MPERMAQEMVEYWQPRLEGQRSGGGGGTGLVRAALLSQEDVRSVARLEVTRSAGIKANATGPGVGAAPGVAAVGGPGSVVVGASSCQRVYLIFASEEAAVGSAPQGWSRELLGSPLDGGVRLDVPRVGSGRVSVLEWGGVELE